MKFLPGKLSLILSLAILCGCYHPQQSQKEAENQKEVKIEKAKPEIKTTHSIIVPKDKELSPIAGEENLTNPDTTVTVTALGQKFEIKSGQEINFIYGDGIDPDETYFVYESTNDGYMLELRKKNDEITVEFKKLCQVFIVASPNLTNVDIPGGLKFEQIVWTPRKDGSWEVRIGTTERGCKSKALQDIKNLRTKEYENSVPK